MNTPRVLRLGSALLLAVALAACALVLAPGGRAAAAGDTPDRYTPLVMKVMGPPHWFKGSDQIFHLAYELELTNGFPVPVSVDSVTVQDAADGKGVMTLDGAALKAAMSPLASPGDSTTTIPGSGVGVVWLEVPFKSRAAIPARISHNLTVAVPPNLPVPTSIAETGGDADVDLEGPVTIGPPLMGTGWVAVGSCCDGPHRRSLQPVNGRLALGQRFAVDWNGMDSEDRFVVGDPDRNEGWTFYGKPVIAVSDGTVVQAVDRFPDQTPNHPKPVDLEEADGNHIIIKLGPHLYAGYAHLVRGSITVKPGQHVHRGEVIGMLGNSGSSTGPHLHFQVMDAPSLVDAEGLPFEIDRFQEVGQIPPLSEALVEIINAGKPVPVDRSDAGARRGELPLGRDVVDFPG
jgi:Peptidase family M23